MIAHFEFTTDHLHRMDILVQGIIEARRVCSRLASELKVPIFFEIEGAVYGVHKDEVQQPGACVQPHSRVHQHKEVPVCAGLPVQSVPVVAHNDTGAEGVE